MYIIDHSLKLSFCPWSLFFSTVDTDSHSRLKSCRQMWTVQYLEFGAVPQTHPAKARTRDTQTAYILCTPAYPPRGSNLLYPPPTRGQDPILASVFRFHPLFTLPRGVFWMALFRLLCQEPPAPLSGSPVII